MSGFYESFDRGLGALNHVWNRGDIDTGRAGQVTLRGDSGMMEQPWGVWAGHGYGTYTATASMTGYQQGPAILLWPGNDRWPGPEIDLVEFGGAGLYGTVHWREPWGSDGYATIGFPGVDMTRTHTYQVEWQPGRLTYSVDGRVYGSFTDHVPVDAAHGGVNMTMGVMNRSGSTSITIYDFAFTPAGSDAPAAAAVAAPAPAPAAPAETPGSGARDAIHIVLDTIANGQVIQGFVPGRSVISLDGYGAGATLVNLGQGDVRVTAATGAWDQFHVAGVSTLGAGDYVFA